MLSMLDLLLLIITTTLLLPFTSLATPTPLLPRDISTRNDLLTGACLPTTIIFARGTIEPGNVGLLAGPPFFAALADLIGADSFAVQGVDYPASILGYLIGGDPQGAQTLAGLAEQAATQCPATKIVLAGYSQGAQVVHLAAASLSDEVIVRVAGVVMFGDPDDGQPLAGVPTARIDTLCLQGDLICDGLPIVDIDHLSYGFTAPQAAQFVQGLLGQ